MGVLAVKNYALFITREAQSVTHVVFGARYWKFCNDLWIASNVVQMRRSGQQVLRRLVMSTLPAKALRCSLSLSREHINEGLSILVGWRECQEYIWQTSSLWKRCKSNTFSNTHAGYPQRCGLSRAYNLIEQLFWLHPHRMMNDSCTLVSAGELCERALEGQAWPECIVSNKK